MINKEELKELPPDVEELVCQLEFLTNENRTLRDANRALRKEKEDMRMEESLGGAMISASTKTSRPVPLTELGLDSQFAEIQSAREQAESQATTYEGQLKELQSRQIKPQSYLKEINSKSCSYSTWKLIQIQEYLGILQEIAVDLVEIFNEQEERCRNLEAKKALQDRDGALELLRNYKRKNRE